MYRETIETAVGSITNASIAFRSLRLEIDAIRLPDGREELFQGILDARTKNLFDMTEQ